MTIDHIHRFITSLVFTSAIEAAVLLFLVYFIFRRRDLLRSEVIFAGFIASFATLPYMWFVFPYIRNWPKSESMLWSEPFIFIIEALIFRFFLQLGWRNSFIASFICNAASFLIGPILRSGGLWIYW